MTKPETSELLDAQKRQSGAAVVLHRLVRRFRILRNWDIQWARGEKYRGQVTINPKRSKAVVHPWGKQTPEAADFRLHEVLHCALRALTRMDRRKVKEMRQAEEGLVQDICAMLRSPNAADQPQPPKTKTL